MFTPDQLTADVRDIIGELPQERLHNTPIPYYQTKNTDSILKTIPLQDPAMGVPASHTKILESGKLVSGAVSAQSMSYYQT